MMKGAIMNVLKWLRRTPVDVSALMNDAIDIRDAVIALEGYFEAAGDKRGMALARKLHRLLDKAWRNHAGNVGGDVSAFSGGVKPD